VRAGDLDHPDELRVDLDPTPGVEWPDVRRVALGVHGLLEELGLVGWPKTSGSRGLHVNVRIHPRWTFTEVRRAALALAREIERRAPNLASSKWWKEERHGVFLDYNQNAKDRTTCSAYSVRPLPDGRVSAPLEWSEVPTAIRPTSPWARCPRASRSAEIRTRAWTPRRARSSRCSSSQRATRPRVSATRPGRRTSARWKARRRAWRRRAPRGGARAGAPKARARHAARRRGEVADRELRSPGLERWKRRHPGWARRPRGRRERAGGLDARSRSSTWTRIRVNLRPRP
jgi:hypothetical protein